MWKWWVHCGMTFFFFPVVFSWLSCFQVVDLNQLSGNHDKGSSLRFGNLVCLCISFCFGFSKIKYSCSRSCYANLFQTKVVFLMTNEFKDFWMQMAFHQLALNSSLGPLFTGKVLLCLTGSISVNIHCCGHQVMTSFMRVIWFADHKMSFDNTQYFIDCYSRDVIVAGQLDKTFCLMLALRLSPSYCLFLVQC